MNKPITIVYEDFKQNMINIINDSGLPMFMVEPVLQNCLSEVRAVMQRQQEMDKEQYEKSLQENNE